MRKPCVFVSSTFFDLKQVRADLSQFLESLGLEPVLSEMATFPVSPDKDTVESCLKAVTSKADIFILVVGARYGSISDDGKSVTNLEFLTARAKGIPIYIFVLRSVLEILPVWKANPLADFSTVADTAKLFEFVASLKEKGNTWVFPFDTAQDITEILRTQIAYLLMEGLELRQHFRASESLSPYLRELQGTALRLIVERPPGWEYLVFSQVLSDALTDMRNLKTDWQHGIAVGKSSVLRASQFVQLISTKIAEAKQLADNLERIFKQVLPIGLAPAGVSGDAELIVHAAQKIADVYREALEWKLDLNRLIVPPEVQKLKDLVGRFCDNLIVDIETFSDRCSRLIPEAIVAARAGQARIQVDLTLKLSSPPLDGYAEEFQQVNNLIRTGKLN